MHKQGARRQIAKVEAETPSPAMERETPKAVAEAKEERKVARSIACIVACTLLAQTCSLF